MKKFLLAQLCLLLLASMVLGQVKVTQLPEVTSTQTDDLFMLVRGAGAGANKKIKVQNLGLGGPCSAQTPGEVVITCAPYSADSTGAIANIIPATNQAIADGYLHIIWPQGTYTISQAQITANFKLIDLFGHDGVHISGAGRTRTFISFPSSVSLHPSSTTTVIATTGANDIEIDGITFIGASTVTGAHGLNVIAASEGQRFNIHDCKFVGWNAPPGIVTGAVPISLFASFNNLNVNTTLGTTIAAGVRTVTPASMANISINSPLTIGGSVPENITVSDVTATTYTATFAQAHNSSDPVTSYTSSFQYARVYRNWILNCPNSQGIVINSSGNDVSHNLVEHVGINGLEHAYYIQAGHNTLDDDRAHYAYGYSFHQHSPGNPAVDESGNVYTNFESLNPGTAHFNVDTTTTNGSNPVLPSGFPTMRFVTIAHGLCRNTGMKGFGLGMSANANGVLVDGVNFEDAGGFSEAWVTVSSYSSVVHSTFRSIQTGFSAAVYIVQAFDGAVNVSIVDNEFVGTKVVPSGAQIAVNLNTNATIARNKFKDVVGSMFSIDGSDKTVIDGNRGNTTGDNNSRFFNSTFSPITNLEVYGNNLSTTAAQGSFDPPPVSAVLHDNTWNVRLFDASSTLTSAIQIWNDSGAFGGSKENGRLLFLPTGGANAAIGAGKLVKLSGGNATLATTTDTIFAGIAPQSLAANSSSNIFLVAQPGAIFNGLLTDGAWTAGNYGIISTGTNGLIHDSGLATPPASGSCVVFLDSGGGPGSARVMIVRTF